MIHFFPLFSRDAGNTLFGEALRATGVPHAIFSAKISFSYRSRIELLLVCLPQLASFAWRSAWRSMRSTPAPDAVVVSSDVEVLIFSLVRLLSGRQGKTAIALSPFIYTKRSNALHEWMRLKYYRLVMRCTDLGIVHSRLEVTRYARLFPASGCRFIYVPFGMNIDGRDDIIAEAARRPEPARPVILSAGKSGRDYATLFAAVAGLDVETRVICDYLAAVPPVPDGANVTVLTDCHGSDYLREVACADIVVVPLAVSDISAGQMVIIQAMALARPVVTTDTITTRDYVADGDDALLVPIADAAALRKTLTRLIEDPHLRERLGAAAAARYERDHGTRRFMLNLVEAISADG